MKQPSNTVAGISALVEQLMQVKSQMDEAENTLAHLKREMARVTALHDQLSQELKSGKKLLEHCINTGQDPIEAKLVLKESELDLSNPDDMAKELAYRVKKFKNEWTLAYDPAVAGNLRKTCV
jgi:phage shock protein A